jgi:cephalosporin hydroxylase
MDFENEFREYCITKSDINQHLPWISEIAEKCKHATELGAGQARSSRAFLRHDIELHSYDYKMYDDVVEYFERVRAAGRNATLHIENTLEANIAPTDVMLVDSYHSYDQVMGELKLHAPKVRKYIFFHDTTLYEHRGQCGEYRGVWDAVQEFLNKNPDWELIERRMNNNGMTLIGRK